MLRLRSSRSPVVKPEPKPKTAAALPIKPVAEELAFLRKSFKELISAYSTQIEAEIAQLQIVIAAETETRKKFPASRAGVRARV